MANRYFNQFVLTQDKRQVIISGIINLSSAAAVTSENFNSLVASVTKSGTGEYTITLTDKYQELKSFNVSYEGLGDTVLRIKSTDVSSAKTLIFETFDLSGAAVADVSVVSKIHVNIVLKDSSVSN
jgi:hypothetical protein